MLAGHAESGCDGFLPHSQPYQGPNGHGKNKDFAIEHSPYARFPHEGSHGQARVGRLSHWPGSSVMRDIACSYPMRC